MRGIASLIYFSKKQQREITPSTIQRTVRQPKPISSSTELEQGEEIEKLREQLKEKKTKKKLKNKKKGSDNSSEEEEE